MESKHDAIRLEYRVTLRDPRAVALWTEEGLIGGTKPKRRPKRTDERSLEVRIECCIAGSRSCTTARAGERTVQVFREADDVLIATSAGRAGRMRRASRRSRPLSCRLEVVATGTEVPSPAGPARTFEGTLRVGRERLAARVAIADEPKGGSGEAIMQALFNPSFFGADLGREFGRHGGLPVAVELGRRGHEPSARLELVAVTTGVDPAGAAPGSTITPIDVGGTATVPAGVGGGSSRTGPIDGLTPEQLEEANEALALLLGYPIDAGIAYSPGFYAKLGAAASTVARLVLPFEQKALRFDLDWFTPVRGQLIARGFDAATLDEQLPALAEHAIAQELAEAESLDDVQDVTNLLTPDEAATLEEVFAREEGTSRWFEFLNAAERLRIGGLYLSTVLAAPIDLDLQPPADFSEWLEGSVLEGATATYDSAPGELVVRNALGVMHVHLFDLRVTVRPADPAVTSTSIGPTGPQLTMRLDFCQLTFGFWTEPSAEIGMIITRILTLGLTDAALWNLGVGDVSCGASKIVGQLGAARDGGRLEMRCTAADSSQVDVNAFAIGWNPLQDLALLVGVGLVSLFDGGREQVLRQVERRVNALFEDDRHLEFPRSFTCGSALTAGQSGADPATRALARTRRTDPVLTPGLSLYLRGTYDFAGPGRIDAIPFVPRLPSDLAYVLHRRVLAGLVLERLDLVGLRPGLEDPALAASIGLPAVITDARRLDDSLIDAVAAAGFMTLADAAAWKEVLALLRGFLAMDGFDDGALPLIGAVPRPTLVLDASVDVRFSDGLDGLPIRDGIPDPFAVATIEVTGRHRLGTSFVTESGRDARRVLLDYWTRLEPYLTESTQVRFPPELGEVAIVDVTIARQLLLTLALAHQGSSLFAGVPPAIDLSLGSETELDDRASAWHVETPELRTPTREKSIRDVVARTTTTATASLQRPLAVSVAHLDPPWLATTPRGLRWHAARPDRFGERTILALRTVGERAYLDLDIEPHFLGDLGFDDLMT